MGNQTMKTKRIEDSVVAKVHGLAMAYRSHFDFLCLQCRQALDTRFMRWLEWDLDLAIAAIGDPSSVLSEISCS